MDQRVIQKMNKVMSFTVLDKQLRASLMLSALYVKTRDETERFLKILDGFIELIEKKQRKGASHAA